MKVETQSENEGPMMKGNIKLLFLLMSQILDGKLSENLQKDWVCKKKNLFFPIIWNFDSISFHF